MASSTYKSIFNIKILFLYSTTLNQLNSKRLQVENNLLHNELTMNNLKDEIDRLTSMNTKQLNRYQFELEQYKSIIDELEIQLHNQIESINFKNNEKESTTIIPILLFTCNRSFYLNPSLNSLLKIRKEKDKVRHPIIVSQDCDDLLTTQTLNRFKDDIIIFRHQNYTKVPSYEAIANHYKWALSQVFRLHFEAVIVLEDDLEVSPDFLDYFNYFYPVLLEDSSLFCISAWNDFGKTNFTNPDWNRAVTTFQRTEFFPGLGWLLTSKFWNEIVEQWPTNYWDDFLRTKLVTKGRHCIQPQVPRVKNIGHLGTSDTGVYDKHLKDIEYNNKSIDYFKFDKNQFKLDNYIAKLKNDIEQAKLIQLYEIDAYGYKNMTLNFNLLQN
ncbi:GlcNAc transferase [Heterostelium album PN500]|uniref:alpha-1,3-mannosyl-glycoprotein 2-beta-N-acetylglucosaminyltransferase n=1 Tax=Heterostelium pallidum (strain ATCC 26659 / Pp 5 / PN500) TaxID=670386 RepID=D3BAF0_HETP5|nr:GlcNAc transferase [Heterostelium album PN500]EFA81537.1 GlcNAc transferase [Heterostelium album PN500]|eukprot:XP_020433654.1 GlcNAc transferase [Heterostelium album PN500]